MDTSRWMPVVLLVLVAAGAYHLFHVPSYVKYYRRGLNYYAEKEYDRAGTEFLKAASEAREEGGLEAAEIHLNSNMMAGDIHNLHLGRCKRAVEIYNDIIEEFPREPEAAEALWRIGRIYQDRLHRPRQAVRIYKRLIEEWPDHPAARSGPKAVLDIYMSIRDLEQVIIEGRHFLDEDPKRPGAAAIRFLMGDAQAMFARWEKAVGEYERAERDYPGSYHAKLARFEIGNCYQ